MCMYWIIDSRKVADRPRHGRLLSEEVLIVVLGNVVNVAACSISHFPIGQKKCGRHFNIISSIIWILYIEEWIWRPRRFSLTGSDYGFPAEKTPPTLASLASEGDFFYLHKKFAPFEGLNPRPARCRRLAVTTRSSNLRLMIVILRGTHKNIDIIL